jgi:flavin reductase (DIM6/NTAB) family NADH-FMN oxidoreductase RutF
LNVLGKDQQATAYAFFKPAEREGETIGGEPFRAGSSGAPILESCLGHVECTLLETVERGDHSVFIGEVVDAGVTQTLEGRPDEMTLTLRDLGEKVFYGG